MTDSFDPSAEADDVSTDAVARVIAAWRYALMLIRGDSGAWITRSYNDAVVAMNQIKRNTHLDSVLQWWFGKHWDPRTTRLGPKEFFGVVRKGVQALARWPLPAHMSGDDWENFFTLVRMELEDDQTSTIVNRLTAIHPSVAWRDRAAEYKKQGFPASVRA